MASKVIITTAGSKKGFEKNTLSFIRNLSERHLSEIAKKSEIIMKEKIKESISRAESSGNLENSIFSERVSQGRYGVGKISHMNQVAPYWAHVNFGSVAVGASHSHRVPVGGFNPGFKPPSPGSSGERWFVAQGGYSFIPSQPIAPLNYIDKTIFEQNRIVSEVLRNN